MSTLLRDYLRRCREDGCQMAEKTICLSLETDIPGSQGLGERVLDELAMQLCGNCDVGADCRVGLSERFWILMASPGK